MGNIVSINHEKNNIKMSLTQGEYGYKEVIESFNSAKFIKIATYNLGKYNSKILIKSLKEIETDINIEIITNDFNDKINNIYKEILEPKSFKANLIAFRNKKNHSKIICTDSVVYIGSQNYSEASKHNYECGIIIRDKDYIEKVIEFFDEIKRDSYNLYKKQLEELLVKLDEVLQSDKLKIIINKDIEYLKKELEEHESLSSILDNISNSNTWESIKEIGENVTRELNNFREVLMRIEKEIIFTYKASRILEEVNELYDSNRRIVKLLNFNDVNWYHDYITNNDNGDNTQEVIDAAENRLVDFYCQAGVELDIIKESLNKIINLMLELKSFINEILY